MGSIYNLINSHLKENSGANTLLHFIICLFEIILIVSLLPVYYEYNDDTAMNAIASGAVSTSPSEYLVFSNILLGYVLKFLFTYIPTVNWYTWYLLTTLFVGYFGIQYAFSKMEGSVWLKTLKHILILTLLLTGILTLTFTEVAAIAVIGGILLIFTSKPKHYGSLFVGAGLILLCALIRLEVFKMVLLIGVPLFMYLLYRKHYQKILFISMAILVSFGATIFDNISNTNNAEYKEYMEFNRLRSKVTFDDNSQLLSPDKVPVLFEVGWSITDINLIGNYNLDVGHLKFTKEKLTRVVNYGPKLTENVSISFLFENAQISLVTLLKFIYNKFEWLLLFCCIIFLFIEFKWKELALLFLSSFYILVIATLIRSYIEGNLKPNINFGLLLPLGLLLIYFLNFKQLFKVIKDKYRPYLKKGLIVFFVGTLFITIKQYYEFKNPLIEKWEITKKMNLALQSRPETFYVSWVVPQYIPIFDLPFERSKAYSLGWGAGSPSNKDKIERYTGNRNIGVYTIFNKDIVWYFANDIYYYQFAKKVHDFYLSNYPQCTFKEEIIPVTDKNFLIKNTYHIKM